MLPLLHRFKRPRVVCELQRIGLMRQYAQECIRTRGATSRPPCGPRETHGVQMVDPDQDGGVAVSRRGLPAQLGPIPEDGERIEQSCLKRQISCRGPLAQQGPINDRSKGAYKVTTRSPKAPNFLQGSASPARAETRRGQEKQAESPQAPKFPQGSAGPAGAETRRWRENRAELPQAPNFQEAQSVTLVA